MEIDLIRAWPRRHETIRVTLPNGACVADALVAAGWSDEAETAAYAVFGQRVDSATVLRDGDRVELLRPLVVDPKEARRRRAASP